MAASQFIVEQLSILLFLGSLSHSETLGLTDPKPSLSSAPSDARWSSLVARRAHNPKVGGSNPPRATIAVPRLGTIPGRRTFVGHDIANCEQWKILSLDDI